MPHIALRAVPTLSPGQRRADHDPGEKCGARPASAAGTAVSPTGGLAAPARRHRWRRAWAPPCYHPCRAPATGSSMSANPAGIAEHLRFRREAERSGTLPAHYYFDPEIFAREKEEIWFKTWQFVGYLSDLEQSGRLHHRRPARPEDPDRARQGPPSARLLQRMHAPRPHPGRGQGQQDHPHLPRSTPGPTTPPARCGRRAMPRTSPASGWKISG